MKPEGNRDFDNNLTQLLQLLRKIIGSQIKNTPLTDLFSPQTKNQGQNINLNLCFFSFFPMTPEELEELEAIYDDLEDADEDAAEELKPELNASDLDFLRRHGIQY